jgi:hypothetical protein
MANEEGYYTKEAVEAYIKSARLKKKDGTQDSGLDVEGLGLLPVKKLQAEVQKLEGQAAMTELDLEIKRQQYIPKDEHNRIRATMASLVKAHCLGFARLHMDEIADIMGGERGRIPDAIQLWEDYVEDYFGDIAEAGEITMPHMGGGE